MADDGPTSPADSPAYQHSDDDTAPVPVASTILFKGLRRSLGERRALIANAVRTHAAWSTWPIDGWLRAMADLGLIDWSSDSLAILREPTPAEMDAARKDAADPF